MVSRIWTGYDPPRSTLSGKFDWFDTREHHTIKASRHRLIHSVANADTCRANSTCLDNARNVTGNSHPFPARRCLTLRYRARNLSSLP